MSNVKRLKGKQVDPRKPFIVRGWKRTTLPYSELIDSLKTDMAFFIAGIKRQTAHSASQRLSKKLGFKVVCLSSRYDGEKGYTFFRGGFEAWIEKNIREGKIKWKK